MDNGAPGTSWDGSWHLSGGSSSYGNRGVYTKDADATYTFEAALTGYHEVSLRWTSYYTRCSSVSVDVYDGDYLIVTAEVDQQSGGNQWNTIGEHEFNGTARVVIYSGSSDCTTNVDGIRFMSAYDDSTFQASSPNRGQPALNESSTGEIEIEGEKSITEDDAGSFNSGADDSGGCFISIYTGFISSTSEKRFLFYNVIILILAILSLYLMYSLNKKN